MISAPGEIMELVSVMQGAGIRRSADSVIIDYRLGNHIFQVFHMLPEQSSGERRHEYSGNCWCHPDTDGNAFIHMRAH